jgi:CRISPR type III-A-associated protein Csm2
MSELYDDKRNQFVGDYVPIFLKMGKGAEHRTVDAIKGFMEQNAYYMTASQLRNIFSRVKTAKPADMPLLRVKIAYIQGRPETRSHGMKYLLTCLDELMQQIGKEDTDKLDGLKAFFEAVLAYHKFYEKKQPKRK